MPKKETKIVVAMSGGVDSSVAAALLAEKDYEVIGMMLRLWSEPGLETTNRCCSPAALALAKQVADQLCIPFYVIDAKDIFRDVVVQYFIDGYAQGITPNPCLICNQQIRWEFLLNKALSLGAEYLATGHYARVEHLRSGRARLLQSVDKSKDQSYVLGVLNHRQLKHALFPVGIYTKKEVRKLAKKHNLAIANTKDSQDLCFLAGSDYGSFLRRNTSCIEKPGPIIMRNGKVVGRHTGLAFYTIGQRKRLGISSPYPLYVLEKVMVNNTLIIGSSDELGRRELVATGVNWVCGNAPEKPFKAKIKIRYKAPLVPGEVTPKESNRFIVKFEKTVRDITPGQAAVIYKGEEVVASGIIEREQITEPDVIPEKLSSEEP